jgi:hypothetical protein
VDVRAWTDAELAQIAYEMRRTAARGAVDGTDASYRSRYFRHCRRVVLGTSLIFTRDTGHHTSGWFRNPDYERCLHLSTSPAPSAIWTPNTPDLDEGLRAAWVRAFFGDDVRYVWAESPKTQQGRQLGVWHWRLFCDEHWTPIMPRGEVYSSEFTELGWRSASELGIYIESPLVPG